MLTHATPRHLPVETDIAGIFFRRNSRLAKLALPQAGTPTADARLTPEH
jgi:hypothetical protein